MQTLLIVDDDISLLESLKMHFEDFEHDGAPRYRVVTATSAAECLKLAREVMPSVIILDMKLPDRTGLDIIKDLKSLCGEVPIIIVTAFHDMETTIQAMKAGAFDYIHKPFPSLTDLDRVVEEALKHLKHLKDKELPGTTPRPPPDSGPGGRARLVDIVGKSRQIQELTKDIGKVVTSRATVLIHGESGTGKELIARVIHNYSYDEPKPFIGINCSAIVESLLESELFGHERGSFTGANAVKQGKFEVAEDGTVFLDEIGDMSLTLQAKLLRVLQEREFERVGGVKRIKLRARVIAATHRNLAEEVESGRFREDLYQRLKVITLQIPPLRERREDIPLLVGHLLERINEKVHKRVTRVPPEVLEHLKRLPWRGNVRELENVLERAVVLAPGEVLLPDNLPAPEPTLPAPGLVTANGHLAGLNGHSLLDFLKASIVDVNQIPTLEEAEQILIELAMNVTKGHKGKTCEILGISRPTLERKLQKYAGRQPQ